MDYALAHFNMIEQQIRPWDVLDSRILDTMAALPRHYFVPDGLEGLAYSEVPIPLTKTAVMLEPKMVGRFLQALDPQADEVALEIGTGSGYLTALLASLCTKVDSVDIDASLTDAASARLMQLGINNAHCHTGDAKHTWPDNQHYDVIALTAAVTNKPQAYLEKLKVGGRLVAVVGAGNVMEAICYTRSENHQWNEEVLFETQLPYFVGKTPHNTFTF
jgi:protein-L-isoaspartate(D-aspartate) O-methyltransferase